MLFKVNKGQISKYFYFLIKSKAKKFYVKIVADSGLTNNIVYMNGMDYIHPLSNPSKVHRILRIGNLRIGNLGIGNLGI